jgi:hypothetical protein
VIKVMELPVSAMDIGVREALTTMVSSAGSEVSAALNEGVAAHASAAPKNNLANT